MNWKMFGKGILVTFVAIVFSIIFRIWVHEPLTTAFYTYMIGLVTGGVGASFGIAVK